MDITTSSLGYGIYPQSSYLIRYGDQVQSGGSTYVSPALKRTIRGIIDLARGLIRRGESNDAIKDNVYMNIDQAIDFNNIDDPEVKKSFIYLVFKGMNRIIPGLFLNP